ncbi:small conductance mechanosensitive channel [Deinococcus metalli]|uniref:Mechanosensitive ion channel protein MscS n=1 Tax=Deinococcus metalli TaxID=1141878 RepID=A0A7W8KM43_9DEIO|nr:mechanosensitive ion channel family protein [Deinococcus metalli]MBB5379124.1 small conductance mechanosensitive channel [Deinococcus metalli]GHF64478.1 mechanosensitive ion channel protein MscS [Deinococcus metalli]
MWSDLLIQFQKPQVWLGLALTLLVAYALYRFGHTLLKLLEHHVGVHFRRGLDALWLLVVVVGWLSVATTIMALSSVPVLYDLGQDIVGGFRHSAGQFLVVFAMALIAWNLIGTLSRRIVADEEFNRRTVRVQTLKGVVESTLRVIVVVIALISALQALGINPTGLLAGVSVFGLAVGFGAQSLIKDVFNGFFILLEDQYGVGDVITVNSGQLSGGVERVNLRVTALRALDGTVHIVPNGQINTVSVSSKDWSRVVAEVDVTYAANINDALRVLERVSNEIYEDQEWNHFFLEKPEMQGVTQLAPDGVTLRALFKVQPKSQYAIGREFNRRIKIAMDQSRIEIPFPQRSLNFGTSPIEVRLTRAESTPVPKDLAAQDRQNTPVKPSLTRDEEPGELTS